MPIIEGLGERIREARTRKGISLEELARKVNSNRRSLYSYEKGLVDPRIGDLLSIAAALDVPICELILGTQHKRNDNIPTVKLQKLLEQLKSITPEEWQEILRQR